MHHILHLDERWFYMTKINQRYYLVDGEEPPLCTTRHKGHIEKIMFVSVVGCPHDYVTEDGQAGRFNGKIGIWAVGSFVEAAQNSRNCARGTPVWKNETMNSAKC